MNEIQEWLNNPYRDYDDGVALFSRYGKNKALARYFQTGTARFRMAKLVYEMGKVVSSMVVKTVSKTVVTTVRATTKSAKPDTQVPDYILAAKKEISSLYSLIDKQHSELYELGTSNAEDIVRKRKKILDKRKPIIERAERIYVLKEDWFSLEDGPSRIRVINEIKEMLSAPLTDQPAIMENVTLQKQKEQLKNNIGNMTDLYLSKRVSQLRTSITKTQNMLRFQSIRKSDTPSPMPDGPKRDEYEKKLKVLKSELKMSIEELERRLK